MGNYGIYSFLLWAMLRIFLISPIMCCRERGGPPGASGAVKISSASACTSEMRLKVPEQSAPPPPPPKSKGGAGKKET